MKNDGGTHNCDANSPQVPIFDPCVLPGHPKYVKILSCQIGVKFGRNDDLCV